MIQPIGSGAKPADLAAQGVTPQNWMAASPRKFSGYGEVHFERAFNDGTRQQRQAPTVVRW